MASGLSSGERVSCLDHHHTNYADTCTSASRMADPEPASTDLYSESKADDKSGHETEEIVTGSPHSDGVEQSASSNLEARDVSGEDVANQGESEESEEQVRLKPIMNTHHLTLCRRTIQSSSTSPVRINGRSW